MSLNDTLTAPSVGDHDGKFLVNVPMPSRVGMAYAPISKTWFTRVNRGIFFEIEPLQDAIHTIRKQRLHAVLLLLTHHVT